MFLIVIIIIGPQWRDRPKTFAYQLTTQNASHSTIINPFSRFSCLSSFPLYKHARQPKKKILKIRTFVQPVCLRDLRIQTGAIEYPSHLLNCVHFPWYERNGNIKIKTARPEAEDVFEAAVDVLLISAVLGKTKWRSDSYYPWPFSASQAFLK